MNLVQNDEWRDTLDLLEVIISSLVVQTDIEEIEAEYLHSISTLIPAHAIAIYHMKYNNLKPIRIAARGVDEDFLSYYENRGRVIDPLRRWIFNNRRPNQSQLLLGLKGWQHHPVYRVVGTAEIDFAMQSPMLYGKDIVGTLNFGRHLSEGAFSEQDLKAVSIISNFLSLAIQRNINSTNRVFQQEVFCQKMNRAQHGIIISGYDNALLYSNVTARRIIGRLLSSDQSTGEVSRVINDITIKKKSEGDKSCTLPVRSCPLPSKREPYTLILLDENPTSYISENFKAILTKREIDVMLPLVKGRQNREIAQELHISINTVKRHLDNIFHKMDVSSRSELIAKVYRNSLSRSTE